MPNVRFKSGLLIALSGVALSACFDLGLGASSNSSTGGSPAQVAPTDPASGSTTQGNSGIVTQTDPPASVSPPSQPDTLTSVPQETQNRNSVPTISGMPSLQVMAGTRYSFQPSANDGDGDALVFSASGLPAWAGIDAGSGLVSGIPAETDAGQTADIVVSVRDGRDSAALPAFRIVVTAPPAPPAPPPPVANAAPQISGAPVMSVQAQSSYGFMPSASDPEGQRLVFSIANKPSWAAFSTATGALSGTPGRNQDGTYANIVISVSDGSLSTSLPAFSIVVTAAPNAAPTIRGTPASSVTAASAYSFQPFGDDADGDALTFSISGKPSWATFDAPTGAMWGTPTDAQAGTYSNIVIRVSDGRATTALPAFSIVVNAKPNTAPTISGSPATSVAGNSAYTFRPSASDADGDLLTYSVSGLPSWATFDGVNGSLSGTPTDAQAGTYSNIVIRVSDGHTSTSLPAFSIVVTRTTLGSATLTWSAPVANTDGSALSDLSGYRIYYGTNASSLGSMIQVSNPGITTYVVDNLTSGTWYFAVSAYNASGAESDRSTIGSKAIP
jgi:hypothetical protein